MSLIRTYWGWFGKREWTPTDKKVGAYYSISIDIQLLLGIILLLTITSGSFDNFSAIFANAGNQSFALEHIVTMLLAMVLAHVSVAAARRATEDVAKHRRAAI